jgi:hypothetical protein
VLQEGAATFRVKSIREHSCANLRFHQGGRKSAYASLRRSGWARTRVISRDPATPFRFTIGRSLCFASARKPEVVVLTGNINPRAVMKSPERKSLQEPPQARHRKNTPRRSFEVHFQKNLEFGRCGHHPSDHVPDQFNFFLRSLHPQGVMDHHHDSGLHAPPTENTIKPNTAVVVRSPSTPVVSIIRIPGMCSSFLSDKQLMSRFAHRL